MMRTIIQRDLSFYRACVEMEQGALRCCVPDDEPKHRRRINALQDLVRAMELVAAVIEDTK